MVYPPLEGLSAFGGQIRTSKIFTPLSIYLKILKNTKGNYETPIRLNFIGSQIQSVEVQGAYPPLAGKAKTIRITDPPLKSADCKSALAWF